jgi:hypothetical protein
MKLAHGDLVALDDMSRATHRTSKFYPEYQSLPGHHNNTSANNTTGTKLRVMRAASAQLNTNASHATNGRGLCTCGARNGSLKLHDNFVTRFASNHHDED